MAIQNLTPEQLKDNIEKVIKECYSKSKQKKFKDLNFAFQLSTNSDKILKTKLQVFKSLDIYSKTFLSIHTKAKGALREFQEQKFEENYLELLRLVLTLPDELNSSKLKSKGVREKQERTIKLVDLTLLKPSTEQDRKAIELLININSMEVGNELNSDSNTSINKPKKEPSFAKASDGKRKVIQKSITSSPQEIHSNARIIKSTMIGKDIQKEKDFKKEIQTQLEDINL